MMDEIQSIVNSAWQIDANIGGGTLSGSPNNLKYNYEVTYSDSGTIVPGVPAATITPAFYTPALVSPAVPGWGTVNMCGPWSNCTTEVPGTPAYTITPGFETPAVVTPAIPALTGGYSTELDISAQVVGISEALEPLFSTVTFKSGAMDTPNSSGLANETVTYNLDQEFVGTALQISGSAAFENLTVDVAGIDTNFGDIPTGEIYMTNVPNAPISFDAVVIIPSYNDSLDILNTIDGVGYSLFPQTNNLSVENLEISTGVTAVADFIDDYLLSYLTDFWNASVVPLFTAVGADAPEAPTETLSKEISSSATSLQNTVNTQGEQAINSVLKSSLSSIQPYVQDLTAIAWDYSTYPIAPGGNYTKSIMSNGLFSGVDASNADFTDADLSNSDFSYSNVTGSSFTGANLTGANFTGSTGAANDSLNSAKLHSSYFMGSNENTASQMNKTSEGNFKDAILFGADFKGAKGVNLDGAFYNNDTSLGTYSNDNLQLFSAPVFVASNKKLISKYGLDFETVTGAFIADSSYDDKINSAGIRADVITGELNLSSFKHKKYRKTLSSKVRDRLADYNGDYSKKDLLAIHKIASKEDWTKHDSAEYLTANSNTINKLGGSTKAIQKAKSHYLNKGIFRDHSLQASTSTFNEYIQKYPSSVGHIGGLLDEASLAYHFVTSGFDQGQTFL